MRNLLTDIPGIAVGHATDIAMGTGVTAILFDAAATASGLISGGAPGSRDTALLEPEMTQQRVSGFVLSGGSLFGLDAAGGVQAWLRERKRGISLRGIHLPIVPQAILFDLLNGGDKGWARFSPYAELGYAAAEAAGHGDFALGSVGAGTGATTATVKGGIGSASMTLPEGYTVAAIVAVNAVGTATIGDGPHFWAAPFEVGDEFGGLGMPARLSAHDLAPRLKGLPPPATATTIGLVATDAALTKAQAKRLAIMANDGLARAVFPAHAPADGDTVFAAATGAVALADEMHLTLIGQAATQVFARAIARGVYEATPLPYPPAVASWRQRFR
jgi:L-aminopeptidase/D-esterase-like protein